MTIMGMPPVAPTQTGTDPPFDSIPPPQITYQDPDGNLWPLSNLILPNGYVCTAISGIDGIVSGYSSIPLVSGGAVPQLYVPQPGNINIGIYVESTGDVNSYMKLLDSLAYAFFTERNGAPAPGYIIVQRQDGTSRKLGVFCVGGNDVPTDHGVTWATFTFVLQSSDPFWYDLSPNNIVYSLAGTATGILPLLPIAFNSNTVIGNVDVMNDGGAESYPIWIITGPGLPSLVNNTLGRQFSFVTALVTAQNVQVTTQPGQQMAMDMGSGANLWSSLVKSSPRDLWALAKGDNSLSLTMSGAGPGTQISLFWTRRWLRA